MERHNENLEMRFERLSPADIDDINLQISQHKFVAGGSTSQQDNECPFIRPNNNIC